MEFWGQMDERQDGPSRGDDMSLTELVEASGVSVRTVRYYIAEGLLPPPLGAGPRASYTAEHLDRLRLIARLKDAYLPLREIRRRLRGLDAAAVRALLAEHNGAPGAPVREQPAPYAARRDHRPAPALRSDEDSAAAYLARLLPPRRGEDAVRDDTGLSVPFALESSEPVPEPADSPEQRDEQPDPASLIRADLDRGAALAALDSVEEPELLPAEPWHRLRLGDDAELLIRASAYDRQREQVDSLVAWARRMLG